MLRTPGSCFENLPDYDFAVHDCEICDADGTNLRIHHLDEGSADTDKVLLLHGESIWCCLHRKIVPRLVAKGYRAIAPDLIGFACSDKLADRNDYSYERLVHG